MNSSRRIAVLQLMRRRQLPVGRMSCGESAGFAGAMTLSYHDDIALLRHQLTVLERSVARPHVTRLDRIVLVALAAITPTWRNVLRMSNPRRFSARTAPVSRLSGAGAAGQGPRCASRPSVHHFVRGRGPQLLDVDPWNHDSGTCFDDAP
jgi:hypothetical protein